MAALPSDVDVVDYENWAAARRELLVAEKAHARAGDELARARRSLPWVPVDNYTFHSAEGAVTLADLFGPHPQLVIYHFMYGSDWEEGCPSCSFWADNFNGSHVHFAARDTAFAAASTAPIADLEAYRQRMGWDFPWVSAGGSGFNEALGVTHTPAQLESGEASYNFGSASPMGTESAGLSVFAKRADGSIYLTYQTFARGLDAINGMYRTLDLTPLGRHEDDLPWTMAWLRRHDQYDSAD